VHFAETHGNDQDRERPHVWPYRDWLVDAFNRDLPYAAFVEQQLAADVLFPEEPRAIAALGFLAAGPWDESSQLNIGDDTLDKRIARNLDRDDMLTTTMATFVSTTVQCARCHNHKFDPIAQTDYYRLQSVFAGIDRADRPFDVDPVLHAKRWRSLRRRLDVGACPPRRRARPTRCRRKSRPSSAGRGRRRPLGVVGVGRVARAAKGAISRAARPSRNSPTARSPLLGCGPRRTPVVRARAAGVGRRARLDLASRRFAAGAAVGKTETSTSPRSPSARGSELRSRSRMRAPITPDGWTAAMAIDGKPETAWGIHPQVGRAHHAVFAVQDVLGGGVACEFESGSAVHGEHHLIGRMRLAATGARSIARGVPTEKIRALLAKPTAERTSAERGDCARRPAAADRRRLAALPPPQLVYAGTTDFTPEQHVHRARHAAGPCAGAR
jgi:hypothetical protein